MSLLSSVHSPTLSFHLIACINFCNCKDFFLNPLFDQMYYKKIAILNNAGYVAF